MSGGELTLGAVLARLEEREREIAAQADLARERIAELSAQLEEFHGAAEEIRITRKRCWNCPNRPRPRRRPHSCRTIRPTSRSWRCSPRPTARCGPGRCARRWTCRWVRILSRDS